MVYEFTFPDVGEGIAEGEIVKWLVKEGDKVREDDVIVKIETDKAVVDIPSPRTGKIIKIHFQEGQTIHVGEVLVTIDDGSGDLKPKKEEKPEEFKEKKSVSVVGELEEATTVEKPHEVYRSITISKDRVLAVPRIRRLAQQLGVDITSVKASGDSGRIIEEDVIAASKGGAKKIVSNVKVAKKYDLWGFIDRVPLKGVRKTIARNMLHSSHHTAAVTSMIDVDVTNLWDLRAKDKIQAEKKDIKLTFFPYIIKAVILGLREHPYLNSELQEEEIILKKYYNIGIAVDTDHGLMVPVIKRAETKHLYDIAKEISDLSERAKKRELDIMDLKGGSFTITNYGSIGGTYGTPIINPSESAILGLGRIFDRVTLVNSKVENRKVLPLSLTFDHRILDGAEAARFLNVVKDYLENPGKIKYEGDKV